MTVTRRQVLVAGALVPIAWVTPQIVPLETRAYADRHSGPPRHEIPRTDAPEVIAEPVVRAVPRVSAATGVSLPYTDGAEYAREVAVAGVALAAGAAAVIATHEPRARA